MKRISSFKIGKHSIKEIVIVDLIIINSMARKKILEADLKRLFALSGNRCAFPGCNRNMIDEDGDVLGQVCHIEAAEEGGERFNPKQSDDERRAVDNLMLLCYDHHVKTDDVIKYKVADLKRMKSEHEARFISAPYTIPTELEPKVMDRVWKQLDKLYKIATETKVLVEESLSVGVETNECVQEILKMIRTGNAPLALDKSDIYAQQLDFIKKFRQDMMPATGLAALEKFKEDNWDKITPELRYKVLANLGALLLDLGRRKEAADYLIQILEVQYESPDSLAFVSLGYFLRGMKDEFEPIFQKAKAQGSLNTNLWISFVGIYSDYRPAAELETEVPLAIRSTPQLQFALGQAFVDQGDFKRGFQLMEQSTTDAPKGDLTNWQIEGMMAVKKLYPIAGQMKLALKSFTTAELAIIKETIDVLTGIWEKVRETEYRGAAWYIILNRGVCYHALGDGTNAARDFEEAWGACKSVSTFRNLLNQYMLQRDFVRARRLIDEKGLVQLEDLEDKIELEIYASRPDIHDNNPDLAAAGLKTLLQEVDGEDRLRILNVIALLYSEAGAFAKAQPYAEQIISEFKDKSDGYISLGICQARQGESTKAIENFEHAAGILKQATESPIGWVQLGYEFYDLKQFTRAAECLEEISKPDRQDEVNRKLLLAYFNAGEYDKALALGRKMADLAPGHALISEVMFRIYHHLGRKTEAEALLTSYWAEGDPQSFDHFRLLGIKFFLETGSTEKAILFALEIERPHELSVDQRFFIARLLIWNGHTEKGLEFAYEARLDNYESGHAHSLFVHTLMGGSAQSDEVMFPNAVELECGVEIEDGTGEKHKYFLTDDPRLRGSSVLRSSESLSKLLVGKGIGETVSLPNSLGVGNVLTITQILNKHTYAFRESLELLEKKYSHESGLITFKGQGNGDPTEFLKYITETAKKAEDGRRKLMSIFSRETIPVGMVGKRLGSNIVETWTDIIFSQDAFLKSYTYDESSNLTTVLAEKDIVVVDPLALLTNFGLIKSAQLLGKVKKKFVIAQSAIVELREHRLNFNKMRPGMSVTMENGELRKMIMTKEEAEAHISFIDSMLQWCEQNATVRDPSLRVADGKMISEAIGDGFYDSLLLAHELDGGLLSDDQHIKSLGLGQFDLLSFSSYQLAVHLMQVEALSKKEFIDLSIALIKANYAYIPVTGEMLWRLFDESDLQFRPPFTRAVRGFEILSATYCAATIATFAKLLYLNIAIDSLREQAFEFVLRSAKRNKEFSTMRNMLQVMIEHKFALLPVQKNSILAIVQSVGG